ncbi:hypothetical protein BU26DRAFT_559006 [Trematosphaeria pertusa]|uniref:Uncharacterized protein n=1 Tax=Trematosphaeria pertusa TaxID=390896 RepID=A0A6A6IXG0_9PLEO|nr:uncharacterized protein BU26DRAFT_559006 [Trematosphaeria pertusa]KAF2254310.1 hypothetical protein BU26DRAFT_559006 [Trematosphaeria pertusa]
MGATLSYLHPTGRPFCGRCGELHREHLHQINTRSQCRKCGRRFHRPADFRPLKFSAIISQEKNWGDETRPKVDLLLAQIRALMAVLELAKRVFLNDEGELLTGAGPYLLDVLEVTDQLRECLLNPPFAHNEQIDKTNEFKQEHNTLAKKLPPGWEFTRTEEVSVLMPLELIMQYLLESNKICAKAPENAQQMKAMLEELQNLDIFNGLSRELRLEHTVFFAYKPKPTSYCKAMWFVRATSLYWLPVDFEKITSNYSTEDKTNLHKISSRQAKHLMERRDSFIKSGPFIESSQSFLNDAKRIRQEQPKAIPSDALQQVPGYRAVPIFGGIDGIGIAWTGNFEHKLPCQFCSNLYEFAEDHERDSNSEWLPCWGAKRRAYSCAEAALATTGMFLSGEMWKKFQEANAGTLSERILDIWYWARRWEIVSYVIEKGVLVDSFGEGDGGGTFGLLMAVARTAIQSAVDFLIAAGR